MFFIKRKLLSFCLFLISITAQEVISQDATSTTTTTVDPDDVTVGGWFNLNQYYTNSYSVLYGSSKIPPNPENVSIDYWLGNKRILLRWDIAPKFPSHVDPIPADTIRKNIHHFGVEVVYHGTNLTDHINEMIYQNYSLTTSMSSCLIGVLLTHGYDCSKSIDFVIKPNSYYEIKLVACNEMNKCSTPSINEKKNIFLSPPSKTGQMEKPKVEPLSDSKYRVWFGNLSISYGSIRRYYVKQQNAQLRDDMQTFKQPPNFKFDDIDIDCHNYSSSISGFTTFNISTAASNIYTYGGAAAGRAPSQWEEIIGDYSEPVSIELCHHNVASTSSKNSHKSSNTGIVIAAVVSSFIAAAIILLAFFAVKRYKTVKLKSESLVIKVQCNTINGRVEQPYVGSNSIEMNEIVQKSDYVSRPNEFDNSDKPELYLANPAYQTEINEIATTSGDNISSEHKTPLYISLDNLK